MGHRGTGKSTAVRALADLLPEITKIKGCKYNCDPKSKSALCEECRKRAAKSNRLQVEKASVPVVDLPLGSTEDRICGTIDIERALLDGVKSFETGLLAKANRGFLYIDEVNLLEDHLVDLLLDVAASGRNIVEREGISVAHPAKFVLVGSGNPEEGELRPQLLDRFGLFVEVETIYDLEQRIEIVKRREAFERDSEAFAKANESDQRDLRQRIVSAQQCLDKVAIEHSVLRKIAELCIALKIDGHRGELTIARASCALAAFEGRDSVNEGDVRQVAQMCLRHRLRKDPLESYGSSARIEQALERIFPDQEPEAIPAKRRSGI